jgi:hypothetical protein
VCNTSIYQLDIARDILSIPSRVHIPARSWTFLLIEIPIHLKHKMSYNDNNNNNNSPNHLAPPPPLQTVPPDPRSPFSAGSPNGPYQNIPPQSLAINNPQTLAYNSPQNLPYSSPQPGFTQPSYSPNAQPQQQLYYPLQNSPESMSLQPARNRTSSQISHHSHHSHQSHQSRRSSSRAQELEERRPTLGDTLMAIISAFKGAFDRRT